MSDQYKTTDVIQGKVLAALPWVGGRKTEAVARQGRRMKFLSADLG
jgi:hypothetical protein